MFLAERPAPTGAFDFEALAVPAIGRVLRYAIAGTMPDGRRIWQEVPNEYAIGFPHDLRNGNGGVAIGYRYDAKRQPVPGACGGFMWSTGEDLRDAADSALAARLTKAGPLDVDGLQGNETWRVRRDDEPPLAAYFIDYDDRFDEDGARGHLGDIAIARTCPPLPPPRIQIFPTTPGGPPGRHAGPPANAARQTGNAAAAAKQQLPAQSGPQCHDRRLRTMSAAECADQRQVLRGECPRRHRRMLELKLSGGTDGDRSEQFLLQQRPGLYRLRRRQSLLQRPGGERTVSAAKHTAEDADLCARIAVLRQGLRAVRQFLLPGESDDLNRHVLSQGTSPERTEQGAMSAADSHSDRSALLRIRPHSNRRRKMLRGRECNQRRHVLSGAGQRDRPRPLPGVDADCAGSAGLCGRLYAHAGRQLLQQPLHRQRRHVLHRRAAAMSQRRIPRLERSLRAGRLASGPMRARSRRSTPTATVSVAARRRRRSSFPAGRAVRSRRHLLE